MGLSQYSSTIFFTDEFMNLRKYFCSLCFCSTKKGSKTASSFGYCHILSRVQKRCTVFCHFSHCYRNFSVHYNAFNRMCNKHQEKCMNSKSGWFRIMFWRHNHIYNGISILSKEKLRAEHFIFFCTDAFVVVLWLYIGFDNIQA